MTTRNYWSGDHITALQDNQIFVFGSNPEGRHGAGAAKQALSFGARYGIGRGLSGKTYGLITKNLTCGYIEHATQIVYPKCGYRSVSTSLIKQNIDQLYQTAIDYCNNRFLICYKFELDQNFYPKKSLNGYNAVEIANMFIRGEIPDNIVFHDSYQILIERANELRTKAK